MKRKTTTKSLRTSHLDITSISDDVVVSISSPELCPDVWPDPTLSASDLSFQRMNGELKRISYSFESVLENILLI